MRTDRLRISLLAASLLALPITLTAVTSDALAVEKAVTPEKNPPGDIPDTQVFIDYVSPLGVAMKVPEGWSRKDTADGAVFADKYNTITIAVGPADAAPKASPDDPAITAFARAGRAVKISGVKAVKVKGGPAVQLAYSANSEPNPVTNKQIRLEANRYLFFKNGKLATLDMTAPLGADNVDQWQLMANSFRWK